MICKHYPTILSYFIQVKSWSSWFCLVYFASSLKTLGRYVYSLNSFFIFGSNIFSFLTASVYVSFFVGLTHFFRLKASLSEKCQKVRIYWVPFSLFPTQLRWEETQSPKRGSVEVFDERFSGVNEMDKRFLIRYCSVTSDTTIQS